MKYDKQIGQLTTALGPNYEVRSRGFTLCDVDVGLPSPMGGSVTVCLKKRRWCPGGCLHAGSSSGERDGDGTPVWFGVKQINPDRYMGRGWIAKIAEDIKKAAQAGIEDIIVNHPEWMRDLTPEQARSKAV